MQVLALIILAAASVSGLGSGPYLPSGWRPQGPAFYLPSEVQKPAENPHTDTILQESEASGSDSLREYGPPKVVEVSQDLTRQALPEAVTEQAFVVIEAKVTEEVNGEVREVIDVTEVQDVVGDAEIKPKVATEADAEAVVEALEVAVEQKTTEEPVTVAVTEVVEETTEAFEPAIQVKAIDEAIEETVEVLSLTTESTETTTAVESTEAVLVDSTAAVSVESAEQVSVESTAAVSVDEVVDSNVESTQVQQVSQAQEVSQVEAEVTQVRTTEEVKNVVDALVNLENEIKAQQVQSNEEAVELKSIQILGVEQAPEGFLEYGPPGFREYGPPQAEELLRNGALVQESTDEEQKIENNETRRRRFSPKFRSTKKQH